MLVADCEFCSGTGCNECGFKGWVYLFRRKDGTVLKGVRQWLRSRSSMGGEITQRRSVKLKTVLPVEVMGKGTGTFVESAAEESESSTTSKPGEGETAHRLARAWNTILKDTEEWSYGRTRSETEGNLGENSSE